MVGKYPAPSIMITSSMEYMGVWVMCQIGIVHKAVMKHIQSLLVMSFSPLNKDTRAIIEHKNAESPVAQAPAPALSCNCPKNATLIKILHINQEKA